MNLTVRLRTATDNPIVALLSNNRGELLDDLVGETIMGLLTQNAEATLLVTVTKEGEREEFRKKNVTD